MGSYGRTVGEYMRIPDHEMIPKIGGDHEIEIGKNPILTGMMFTMTPQWWLVDVH